MPVRAHHDRVLDADGHEATAVLTADAVDVARSDPDMRTWFREMVDTGRYDLYRHDGGYPLDVVIPDETVLLALYDDTGGAGFHSVIESTDEAVLSWAVSEFERHRREAEPVDPATLTDGS